MGITVDDFVSRLRKTAVQIIPVDEVIWLENLKLVRDHADPADRTIVASAQLRHLPIMTADTAIRTFYPSIIW